MAKAKTFSDSHLKKDVTHGIVAFGGGVLVAGVAFILAPIGVKHFRYRLSLLSSFVVRYVSSYLIDTLIYMAEK